MNKSIVVVFVLVANKIANKIRSSYNTIQIFVLSFAASVSKSEIKKSLLRIFPLKRKFAKLFHISKIVTYWFLGFSHRLPCNEVDICQDSKTTCSKFYPDLINKFDMTLAQFVTAVSDQKPNYQNLCLCSSCNRSSCLFFFSN